MITVCESLARVAEPSSSDSLHLLRCQLQLVTAYVNCLRLLGCFIYFDFLTATPSTRSSCSYRMTSIKVKGKGQVLDIALLRDEHAQERFTILEVAADWHELMIPQCIMQPSIAHASEQLDPQHNKLYVNSIGNIIFLCSICSSSL